MSQAISVSTLIHATNVLADTNRGLSASKLMQYCNAFAAQHDVSLPHARYPFQAANKRTALLENLHAFPAAIQFRLLMELSFDPAFSTNLEVQALRKLLCERYPHFAIAEELVSSLSPNTITQAVEASNPQTSHPVQSIQPQRGQIPPPTEPYDVFLSYSHEDEELVTFVRKHLVLLDRQKLIRKWWDRKLRAGSIMDAEILGQLSSSDIVLLFVSSSFLASDYCYDVEMRQALRQHQEGRSVVIPVILRACVWQTAPFGNLLALPTDGRPLTNWADRDEGAKSIAEGIVRTVSDLQIKLFNDRITGGESL